MLFTEQIRLIQDLEMEVIPVVSETAIMAVSEILIQVEASDKVTLVASDNRGIPEVSETVIPEVSEIHSLMVDSVIRLLNQDQTISHHSQDITMADLDPMIPEASDPVEGLTLAAASEAVLPAAVAVSDPVAEAEAASDNLSN